MSQFGHKLAIQTNTFTIHDSSTVMQLDDKEASVVGMEEMLNGGLSQAGFAAFNSQRLQDDLEALGLKIRQHEEHIQFLKAQSNKLEESILDLQVVLSKHHSSSIPKVENEDSPSLQSEEETAEQIIQHEKSAAGIFCQLKARHGAQASHLTSIKDVLGIVAILGKVDDENLSRLFSEYLGADKMLAIVCKTFNGVKALESYDKEGFINKSAGLHGLGASIGRALEGRFIVICLENLRPYPAQFIADDFQRRLDLLKPRLPDGQSPRGFLGFAVNMIHIDSSNLFWVTSDGNGLRETLFYNLFSRLQVYKTREDMINALPCISDGALSLDGGIIRSTGVFALGNRGKVDVRFPKPSPKSNLPDNYIESEKQIKELKWKREKLQEDQKREQILLDQARFSFDRKKEEFVKFLAQSSSYATQQHIQIARDRMTPMTPR